MKKLLPLLAIAIIPLLLSCKKGKSEPEPESKEIPLFDLTVYDSDRWTPHNRFPVAANVEVEVFERHHVWSLNGWSEGDSVVTIFSGKTNSKGVVTVVKTDTLNSKRSTYLAKLRKGERSNFSPEGFICEGVFESDEQIRTSALHSKTTKVGDKKLVDLNGDGIICCIYDKSLVGVSVGYSYNTDGPATCWLY